jgi:hypothetical protein
MNLYSEGAYRSKLLCCCATYLASYGSYQHSREIYRYDPNIRTATGGGNCAQIEQIAAEKHRYWQPMAGPSHHDLFRRFSRFPGDNLQILYEDAVKDRHQEQGNKGSHCQAADLSVA